MRGVAWVVGAWVTVRVYYGKGVVEERTCTTSMAVIYWGLSSDEPVYLRPFSASLSFFRAWINANRCYKRRSTYCLILSTSWTASRTVA